VGNQFAEEQHHQPR